MALEITDATLNDVLSNNKNVVIDFWAEWCAPCRMLSPVIDELAKDNNSTLIGKLNVTDNPKTSMDFGITGIPCLVVFKDGVEVGRIKGAMSKAAIQRKIDEILAE